MKLCEDLGVEPADIVMVRARAHARTGDSSEPLHALACMHMHTRAPARPTGPCYTGGAPPVLLGAVLLHAGARSNWPSRSAARHHQAPRFTQRCSRGCAAACVPAQLVIADHMGAAAMGEFTRTEFTNGMVKMGVDSLAALKAKIPSLRQELTRPDRFKDLYNYAYMFSREVRGGGCGAVCGMRRRARGACRSACVRAHARKRAQSCVRTHWLPCRAAAAAAAERAKVRAARDGRGHVAAAVCGREMEPGG